MKTHICPFCKRDFILHGISSHLRYCKSKPTDLSKDEAKLLYIKYNTYDKVCEDIINDYINLYSFTDLRKKYDLDFKSISFILRLHNIKIRTVNESAKLITVPKVISTSQKKWGVNNPSQSQEIKDKKAATFIKHYGVDNVWKTPEYAKFTSDRWASYTPEEKYNLSTKFLENARGCGISKLENRINNILNDFGISTITQYKIGNFYHFYDILISNTKIILEIQGDFWHANPNIYESTDKINYPGGKKLAQDIWKKDSKTKKYAESKGYTVIYIWESTVNSLKTDENIINYIIDLINNC